MLNAPRSDRRARLPEKPRPRDGAPPARTWRKNEILGLTWDEIDEAGGVIRLSPARSKTLVGRMIVRDRDVVQQERARKRLRDVRKALACAFTANKRPINAK